MTGTDIEASHAEDQEESLDLIDVKKSGKKSQKAAVKNAENKTTHKKPETKDLV